MPGKYYAVKKGRKPGVYQSWAECKAMVDGFPGAVYKSFKTREEAVAFAKAATYTGADAAPKMQNAMKKTMQQEAGAMPSVYAFVDGSYNVATHVYGYGGFLIHDGIKEVLQGSDKDAEMAAMRNVAGEIYGRDFLIQSQNRWMRQRLSMERQDGMYLQRLLYRSVSRSSYIRF